MGHKRNVSDKEVLAANRGLTYEPKTKEFREAVPRRLRDSSNTSNYVVFQNNLCNVYAEGTITTNVDMNPVQLVTSGELYHNRDKKLISGSMMLSLNFPIRNDVVKQMTEDLNDVVNLAPVFFNEQKIRRRMELVLGNDTVQSLLKNYELSGDLGKTPNGLNKTIVLNDVKMYYDTATLSYRSTGEIGVGFIGGTVVGKYMKGYVEIIRNEKKGDQISVFLQPTPQRWYYFNYKAGFMYCLSSNDDFNVKIINTKEKDRVTKVDKNEYQFVVGSDESKNKFTRSFNSIIPVDDTDDLQNVNSDIESDDNPSGGGDSDADNTTPGDNNPADDDDSDFILEDDPTPMDDSHEQQQPQQQAQPQQQSDQPAADDEEEQDYIDD
jgi:hypothetical protein